MLFVKFDIKHIMILRSTYLTYILIPSIANELTPPPPTCVTSFMNAPLFELQDNLPWNCFTGTGLALTDIMFISQVKGLRAQIARYLFVMPPYAAMPISYAATR